MRRISAVVSRVASLAFLRPNLQILAFFQLFGLFLFFKKGQIKFGFFWPHRFFIQIWEMQRWFWQVSGHWQISRHCFWTQNDTFSLETLYENLKFFVLVLHAYKFAVSSYSSAKPKVSRGSLMEWALPFLCIKYVHNAFQKRIWVFYRCRCVFILYLAFSRVDLAFFAYDYLATLVVRLAVQAVLPLLMF